MIGKILALSDADGKMYIENAREAWRKHGFLLADMDIETVLQEKQLDDYYMIAIMISHYTAAKHREHVRQLRLITRVPITIFPIISATGDTPFSAYDCADLTVFLPGNLDFAILNCLSLIRRYSTYTPQATRPLTLYVDYKIFLDVGRYTVHVDGHETELHKKEFEILRLLMENRGQILTYPQIYTAIWGCEYHDAPNELLWSHIKHLRQKLQWKDDLPQYIRTKRGVGYSFSPRYEKKP